MQIADFLSPDDTLCDVRAADKDRLLRELTGRAASALRLDAAALADAIAQRERLGSTGMGDGIAIPHARIAGLSKPFGLLARLEKPVAYEAIDGAPVDLFCLVLTPVNGGKGRIDALACIAKRLRPAEIRERIRNAAGGEDIYALLLEES